MDAKTAFFINGPINSGKSTIAKRLAEDPSLQGRFIEGDLLVDETNITFESWIQQTVQLLTEKACDSIEEGQIPFCAFPLRDQDWFRLTQICEYRVVKPLCITLAPNLETLLSKRSGRDLQEWEIKRIRDMYADGFHSRQFSSFIIDNSKQSPDQTVQQIQSLLCSTI